MRVAGAISSPAHFEWTHDVAAALIVHLNRVLRSGYVRGDTSTLAIEIESLGGGSFRVIPSIVRIDAATGESVALVNGGEVCPGGECVIEIVGFLSPLLGDLRVFGDDETALRTYLARRALEPHLESVESDEPVGRIVGQTPDAGTLVDGIPRAALVVRIAADRDAEPRRETIALANLEADATDLQETLLDIGRELGISTEAVSLSLQAVRRGGRDAAYLERIISTHDPRRRDDADLPHSWRAWYELAEPAHAPNFSGSAINGFAREVADALWDRLERAVLDDEAPR